MSFFFSKTEFWGGFVCLFVSEARFISQGSLKLLASASLVARAIGVDSNWTSNFIDKCRHNVYKR